MLPFDPHSFLYGTQSLIYATTGFYAHAEGHGRISLCHFLSAAIYAVFALLG
jgi:hypothetical protein